MKKILNTAKDFKIDKYMDNNLSMSLGAGLVTLQNLTNAYAMIVNGGKEIQPTVIQNVYDKRGNVIINNEQKICFNCIQFDEILNYSLPKIESIDKIKYLAPRVYAAQQRAVTSNDYITLIIY